MAHQPHSALQSTDTSPDFAHYYDLHPTREDLMGESVAQSRLIAYLLQVLEWLFHREGWFVVSDLNIYRRKLRDEYPLAPDVAVFKGVVLADHNRRTFRSWRLYEDNRPPPQVVFEFCSEATWKDDVQNKPAQYAALGVQEYFAYDPNEPPYLPAASGRLRGWRNTGSAMAELAPDAQGWLWSAELASFLGADGAYLRLYDHAGQLRLTRAEAEQAAKEVERAAKEVERAAKEAAWAKLRELGIDPAEL